MTDLVYRLLREAVYSPVSGVTVNDVEKEEDEEGEHILVTLDTPEGYRVVRLDVTDLGEDYLEHD